MLCATACGWLCCVLGCTLYLHASGSGAITFRLAHADTSAGSQRYLLCIVADTHHTHAIHSHLSPVRLTSRGAPAARASAAAAGARQDAQAWAGRPCRQGARVLAWAPRRSWAAPWRRSPPRQSRAATSTARTQSYTQRAAEGALAARCRSRAAVQEGRRSLGVAAVLAVPAVQAARRIHHRVVAPEAEAPPPSPWMGSEAGLAA